MQQHTSFKALRELLKYAQPFQRRIKLATVFSVINKILDIMPEILIGVAIDVVVRQQHSVIASMGIVDPFNQLLFLGFITLLVWAGESLFEYLYLLMWRNLAQDLQHTARMDAYAHVQTLDIAFFDSTSSGQLLSILNDDINQLERFLNGGANSLIQILTTIIIIGSIFFFISPSIAVIAFTPVPVIIAGAFYFQRRAQPLYAKVRQRVGALSERLSANLNGIQTIKSFTAEQFEAANLARDSAAYVDANREAIRISSAFIPVIRMAILLGFVATLVIGGWYALNGKLNVGSYGALVYLTQRLLWPLTGLADVVDLFERAMASSTRVLSLLKHDSSTTDSGAEIAADHVNDRLTGEIVFDRVSFAYADREAVLHEISFSIAAGDTVAFVGPTGSGKSTIVKLLLRFYPLQSGDIKVDGRSIQDIPVNELRDNIGLVAQDSYLFPGSIRNNIAYGIDQSVEAQVEKAAQAAEAMEFIEKLPDGFDTMVGERGQRLSGGQRQRLAIARAIYKDPTILVLDEATSSVDNETESLIQRSLAAISAGRTTLVVAHRLSTIVNADKIVVLENGRISESGTHTELLSKNGLYRSLWDVQTGTYTPGNT